MASFTFTNSTGLDVPDFSHTSQQLAAFGMQGAITAVSVKLSGLTHNSSGDLNFLLVGPDGKANLEFFSNVGSINQLDNVTVTVADSGAAPLPQNDEVTSGTYKPADYGTVETNSDFGSAVPAINHPTTTGTATFASAFAGRAPNGTYTLFASDSFDGLMGSLSGWSVTVATTSNVALLAGSDGNDTLAVASTGSGAGSFTFNSGSPVGFTGLQAFEFAGGDGQDAFIGGSEADHVSGDDGNDTLSGGDGDDILDGGNDKDDIDGGKGGDTLTGGSSADSLSGGAGKDLLDGGSGADEMAAGKDGVRDTFVYLNRHDSGHGKHAKSWDKIDDFDRKNAFDEKGTDKIDLSAIDADKHMKHDQEFRFVDEFAKADKGQPRGEVTIEDSGKDVKVLVDVNGDTNADMIILVTNVKELHKADFLL